MLFTACGAPRAALHSGALEGETEVPAAAATPPVASASSSAAPTGPRLSCLDGKLTSESIAAAMPRPKVAGAPHDIGDPRAEAIADGVCAIFPRVASCRLEAVKKGKVEGTLELELTIDDQGKVTSAKRTGGTHGSGDLSTCVEAAFTTAQVSPSAKGTARYDLTMHSATKWVKMIETGTDIQGQLPPELIKRVLRANFPKLRACYEAQLKKDARATGLVTSEFLIDEAGKVMNLNVTVSGALADPALAPCWRAVIDGLQFEPPEKGKVLVRYPIEVQAGED